jgi:hypothetical protein
MKPVQGLFWVKEQRSLQAVPVGVEAVIPVTDGCPPHRTPWTTAPWQPCRTHERVSFEPPRYIEAILRAGK